MAEKRIVEHFEGVVERADVRRGTGSEHRGVVLVSDAGDRLILQRVGGNPFDDEPTRALVGRRVRAEGYRLGDILRYVSAEPINKA